MYDAEAREPGRICLGVVLTQEDTRYFNIKFKNKSTFVDVKGLIESIKKRDETMILTRKKIIPLILLAQSLQASGLNYDYAIKWARDGELSRSLTELEKLQHLHPENKHLFYDYLSVLGWAKEDKKAISLTRNINKQEIPLYALKDIAKSARNIGAYTYAAKLYQSGIKRDPKDPLFYQGFALVLHDMKKPKLAMRVLNLAQNRLPHDTSILESKAEMYELNKNNFDAMRIYQKLAENPATKDKYMKKFVHSLMRLGMPFVADKYIKENPALFSDEDKMQVSHDQSAFKLRWGKGGFLEKESKDKALIQEVLNELNSNLNILKQKNQATVKNRKFQQLHFDKIVALSELHKRKEAIAIYENLKAQNVDFPSYTLNAIGDAYLYVKEPHKAQKVLKESLKKNKHEFTTKYLLFYAYSDAYEANKALKFSKHVNKNEPKRAGFHKVDAEIMEILAYEYANYLDFAQERLEELLELAPHNGSVRNELARLYYLRGWHDKAREAYKVQLHFDKKNMDAQQGIIYINLAEKRYDLVDADMKALYKKYPNKKESLNKLQKRINDEKKGYFTIESSYGSDPQESGSKTKTDSYEVNGYYYSPLLQNRWRPFVFTNIGHTQFYENALTNKRVGAGVNYDANHLNANVALSYNLTAIEEVAGYANATYKIDHYWSVFGNYEQFSTQTPLRAIMYGIRANLLQTSLRYRFSESAQSAFTVENMDFDDGNNRLNLIFTNYYKLITGAHYNLDTHIYISNMTNSEDNSAVYYNPKEDFFASINFENIWNIYNWYDSHIKQKIGLEVGTHWEKNYGSNLVGNVNIGQDVEVNKDFGLSYGITRKKSAYDGTVEYGNTMYLNLQGRF